MQKLNDIPSPPVPPLSFWWLFAACFSQLEENVFRAQLSLVMSRHKWHHFLRCMTPSALIWSQGEIRGETNSEKSWDVHAGRYTAFYGNVVWIISNSLLFYCMQLGKQISAVQIFWVLKDLDSGFTWGSYKPSRRVWLFFSNVLKSNYNIIFWGLIYWLKNY